MRTFGLPATPRELGLLSLAALFPFLIWLLLDALGLTSLGEFAMFGVVGVVGAAVVFSYPKLGIYGMVAYVYGGLASVMPLPLAPPLMAIILASVILRLLSGDRNRLVDPAFLWSIAIFMMLCVTSALVAYYPSQVAIRMGQYAKVLLLVYLIVQLIRTHTDLRWLVYVVFIAEVSTILVGAFLYMTGDISRIHYIGQVQLIRFTGLYNDPNYAAAYMCAALPLGVFAARCATHKWIRLLSAVGVVLLIVGLFSTFSRAAIFAFSVVVVGVVGREVRGARGTLAMVVIIVTGIMVSPRYYWNHLLSLSEFSSTVQYDWSIHIRLEALRTAWEYILQNPITGIGVNNFVERGSHRLLLRVVVHNSYFEILVGAGIGALMTFFAVIGSGARHAVVGSRHAWRNSPDWMRSLSYYAGLSLASTMVSALFLSIHARYLLWVPLAICLVIGNLMRRDAADRPAGGKVRRNIPWGTPV